MSCTVKIFNKPSFGHPPRIIIVNLNSNYLDSLSVEEELNLINLITLERFPFSEKPLFWFLYDTNSEVKQKVQDTWNYNDQHSIGITLLAKITPPSDCYSIINHWKKRQQPAAIV